MNGNSTIFFPDEIVFLKQNFFTMPFSKLFIEINKTRNNKLTKHVVRNKCYELGLIHYNKNPKWNENEINFLLTFYKVLGNVQLANELNLFSNKTREFKEKNIWKKMLLLKISRTQQDLDYIKWKNIVFGNYASGQHIVASLRTYPEGKINIWNVNGRKYKVIKKGNKILRLQHVIFKDNGGVIPPGHKLYFKDGNSLNCSFDNLITLPASRVIYRNGLTRKLKKEKQTISADELLNPFGKL